MTTPQVQIHTLDPIYPLQVTQDLAKVFEALGQDLIAGGRPSYLLSLDPPRGVADIGGADSQHLARSLFSISAWTPHFSPLKKAVLAYWRPAPNSQLAYLESPAFCLRPDLDRYQTIQSLLGSGYCYFCLGPQVHAYQRFWSRSAEPPRLLLEFL